MFHQFNDNIRQIYLATSLYDCIEDNDINAIQVLLRNYGANPNIILPDKGISPFHLVVGHPIEKNAEEITKLFLQYGGDPNVRSDENMTPVHVAAAWGRVNILNLLLKCGGDPSLIDDEDKTPFDYAIIENHINIVKLLQEFNENVLYETYQNNYNLTLEKVIVNTGNVVAEYDCKKSCIDNVNHYLKQLPENEINNYVKKWCYENANVTREIEISDKVNNETFILSDDIELSSNNCKLNDAFVTRRIQKKYFNVPESHEDNYICNSLSKSPQKSVNLNEEYNNVTYVLNKSFIETLDTSKSVITNKCDILEKSDKDYIEIQSKSTSDTSEVEIIKSNILEKSFLITSDDSLNKLNSSRESGIQTLPSNSPTFVTSLVPLNECRFIGTIDTTVSKNSESSKYTTCEDNTHIDCHENKIIDSLMTLDLSDVNEDEDLSDVDVHNETRIVENSNLKHASGVPCQLSVCNEVSEETFLNIAEEYKYTDEKEGVVLIERRYLRSPQIIITDTDTNSSVANTVASSLPTTIDYDTETLRKELTYRGEEPGPITSTTKRIYLRKLMRLRKTPPEVIPKLKDCNRVYSVELEKTLRNTNWKDDLTKYKELESVMVQQFSNPDPSKRWREGVSKASFTYLLMDPRVTQNLPARSEKIDIEETWKTFLSSIFYVGKGKRSRPYSHLYDAIQHWDNGVKKVANKKILHILDIWNDGKGVICLHIFQNVIPVEAYTREAAIISAIKIQNLKNIKSGDFYGISATWTQRQKRLLGVYLLYRAMLIFLNEGERQLRPDDI